LKTLIAVSRRCSCLLALQLLWLSGFAHAGAAEQLAAHLQNVNNLKAGFVQVVRDDRGEVLEESRGSMTFKRPDKLRWEVAEPYRYQIITDGETLWRYDPDFEELITEPFEQVSQTPIMILAASAEQLSGDYHVKLVAGSELQRFSLKPHKANADFSELELSFRNDLLTAMILHDKLGQTTRIDLNQVVVNSDAVVDSLFVFEQDKP
jgi:outer membrane lipoprotein carrier protein